jgi:hypothetical protein
MTSRRSFFLKIAYLMVIGVLLLPLSFLGQPAATRVKGSTGGGGVLANLRREYKLSEAELGQIDPTSETIKLATFGLRGVAANILWEKANEYDKKKDWTNLSATLQQIAKLEPHFITVWRFQAWRVSYNVSAQFDDFRARYRWVIRGINFLKEGIRYNEMEPVLYWDVGWVTAQKIGRADEHVQFRRLFREDDDFHGSRPPELRDNWLVGMESFAQAEELVDKGASLKKMSPVLFYSERPMCRMNYAEALEDDGIFAEKARIGWERAGQGWHEYGNRDVPTTFGDIIRLNDRAEMERQADELRTQFEAMTPGIKEAIAKQRQDELTDAERQVLDMKMEDRTEAEHELAAEISRKLRITHEQVAEHLIGAQRGEGLDLAKKLTEAERLVNVVRRYQEVVNYEYWQNRAAFEQTPQALDARRLLYEGRLAFLNRTDLRGSKAKFEEGFRKWRELLDSPQFKDLVRDQNLGRDLIEAIKRYRRVLDACDEPFPDNFILQDIIEQNRAEWEQP